MVTFEFDWISYIFTLKYEWIAAVASLRILNRELKVLVLHLRWGNWRVYSTACLSLILKGKSWNQTMKQKTWPYIFYKVRIKTHIAMDPLHFGARYDYFPYQSVTFSDNMDFVCFQFNWLLLVGTLLQDTSDFNSTAKCEQAYLKTTKGCELSWGAPDLNLRNGHVTTYGSFRSELAIICNDCKELPSFTWRKRFFFWGRTERTHPYKEEIIF